MPNTPRLIISAALILGVALSSSAFAEEEVSPTMQKLKDAMVHERRTDADTERDANRKPLETLEFFGLQDDMTVLELLPGGGWYTKLLAPVLEEKGKLYLSIGTRSVEKMIEGQDGYGSTEIIPFEGIERSTVETRRFTVPEFTFGIRKVDLVLTFRNVHNIDATARANLNAAVFQALKKGGKYGIIDHTRRHMQADGSEVWRRIDPVQIIKEALDAGFVFTGYSDIHYKPDDELRYEVGRKSVTGNTDRFTLLFTKP